MKRIFLVLEIDIGEHDEEDGPINTDPKHIGWREVIEQNFDILLGDGIEIVGVRVEEE